MPFVHHDTVTLPVGEPTRLRTVTSGCTWSPKSTELTTACAELWTLIPTDGVAFATSMAVHALKRAA